MPGQRGSEQRRRKHIVHVRMDDGELHALDNLIGDCGWSRAAFIRALIATRGDIRIFEVAPLVAALSKIGGNLNQIARQVNRNGQIDDAQYLRHALDELVACIRNLEDLTL
ncbi:plasmid mobilization protein [Sphingobium yanoikuyae]|uniref:plasmid mobilization protein n=1 Tax=Sphingobium yanoikuyae TaxID=13690 RepID=UPI0035C76DAD